MTREADGMRAVLHALPVPASISRVAGGQILVANPACLEFVGWQEGDIIGRTGTDAGWWQGSEDPTTLAERLRREGAIADIELAVWTKSGEQRVVLASISSIEFDGELCIVCCMYDITERRRVGAQLRESEQRFRQVTESLTQGFMLREVDPPVLLYASPAVERIFGVDPDTLIRDPLALRRLIHPEDLERVQATRDAITGVTDIEFRIIRADGTIRWISTRVEHVPVEHGRVARLAFVVEDITEQTALRESLRESEERFRLLAENSTDVITRSSPDAVLHYVSPASRSLYGYDPTELIGRSGWEFIHPDDRAALRDDLASRGDRPDAVTNEYRVKRRDGSYAWMEAKSYSVRDPVSHEVTEIHTSARDIGKRKEAEAVALRALEEAERANDAKSQFLSRMSHELRTPLHAILGFGGLLEHDDLRAEHREHVQQITKAGRHLLDLINEVLDISMIERGELGLSLEPVHVGQVVDETLNMLVPLALARSVTVLPPVSGELDIYVLADRQRLKQVLLNLLWNAVKYNRTGGEVLVRAAVADSGTARIEVIDTGAGIAAGDLASVFTAFERLGAESTDEEGTGLGLTLTKHLVEAMGGDIGVESPSRRGTTFWFQLPVLVAPEERPAKPKRELPAARVSGAARTVLYIEDNPSNIKLVERLVAKRPEVSLLVASEGVLGVELALEHQPALVLLDLHLPDISGEEALRRLRSNPRTANITVVMVSADATPGQIERQRLAGADGYLTKPFEVEQFLTVIDGQPASATNS
jgi:PAS domain S-box-containing protein